MHGAKESDALNPDPPEPPAPLSDLVIVQVSPTGSAHDALMNSLSSGAVYPRVALLAWLITQAELDVVEIGSASMHPARTAAIPIWQVRVVR